jgi:TolB protein
MLATRRRLFVFLGVVMVAISFAQWLVDRVPPVPDAGSREVRVPSPAPTATPLPWVDSTLAVVVDDGIEHAVAAMGLRPGAGPKRLAGGFAEIAHPAWSPDGAALAFSGWRDGNWDLYRVAADGSGLTRLTSAPDYDGWPAWSPDGRTLAFVSHRGGEVAVYRLAAGESDVSAVRLSAGAGPAIEPTWSPDGRWVSYVAWHAGAYRLEAVPAEGGTPRVLVEPEAGADVRAPSWSPDGRALAYLLGSNGTGQLAARAWNATLGQVGADADTIAGDVSAFTYYPGGDAVAIVRSTRGMPVVEVRSVGRPGQWSVTGQPVDGTAISWTRASVTTGLDLPVPAPTSVMPIGERAGLAELTGVEVPGARINAGLAGDFAALRAEVKAATGRDFLGTLADGWRPMAFKGTGSAFFSWHKTGRAFDTQMELRGPGGRRDMVLVREDLGGRTMWRMFLRAGVQDGSAGRPLEVPGWSFSAGGGDGSATDAGGQRASNVPDGYWVDFTAMAERYGWRRIPSISRGTLDWRRDWEGIEYWHYERRDGLRWFDAMRQVYSEPELADQLAPERLEALGIPLSRLSRQGFPPNWRGEG